MTAENMLIHEVCRTCSLTKKAISYYIKQGLLCPAVQENGYRLFSPADVTRLKKISTLRKLGLSTEEIRLCLSAPSTAALQTIAADKALSLSIFQEKQALLSELAANSDWAKVQNALQQLEQKQSILERLLHVFPGGYGRFVCFHFAPYLTGPITTETQQEAFDTVIAFLDRAAFTLPDDLQQYLQDVTAHFDADFATEVSSQMRNAIQDFETYLADHHETIAQYLAFKQSDDYRNTPAGRLEQALRQFTVNSGYNDVFLPAMRRLSPSYQAYTEKLEQANEQLLRSYPQLQTVKE